MTTHAIVDPANAPALPASERSVDQLEAIVDAGLQTWIEVGTALMELRDTGKWKQSQRVKCDTWHAYTKAAWGMDYTYASRLISGAKDVLALPLGTPPPATESAQRTIRKQLTEYPEAYVPVIIDLASAEAKRTNTPLNIGIVKSVGEVVLTSVATGTADGVTPLTAAVADEVRERWLRKQEHVGKWDYVRTVVGSINEAMNALGELPAGTRVKVSIRVERTETVSVANEKAA